MYVVQACLFSFVVEKREKQGMFSCHENPASGCPEDGYTHSI